MSASLALYELAKSALASYHTIDEVKSFRDKAVALEAYAKQANDFELETHAAVARIRAERRCGEMLSETPKQNGARGNASNQHKKVVESQKGTPPKTLADIGLTKKQSANYQKLAKVPEDEFEAAVTVQGHKPRADHIVRAAAEKRSPPKPEPKRMPKASLWLWGVLCDMERDKLFHTVPDKLIADMTPAMILDVERILPDLKTWLKI